MPVGQVVRDRVVKQHDVLADQADVVAKAPERIVADRDTVQQDLARDHVVEPGQQTHERRLAAARSADDRERPAGLHRKRHVLEHGHSRGPVGEVDVAELDVTPDATRPGRTGIDFVLLVDHAEQAPGCGHPALQRRVDVGDAAHRLQHQDHGAEKRDDRTRGEAAVHVFPPRHVDDACEAEPEDCLRDGHAQRTNADQFQVLPLVAFVDFVEAVLLVFVAPEDLDDAIAPHDLLGDLRDLADRVLDSAAVAPERSAEDTDQRCDDRHQNRDEQRQLRALHDHDGERGQHGQHVPHGDRDHVGHGSRDHLHVVGHPGQQGARTLCIEVSGRQRQEFPEYAAPKGTDHTAADETERNLRRITGNAARDEDTGECEWQPACGFEILCDESIVHQGLLEVDEARFDDRSRRHSQDSNETDQFVRQYIAPQAAVDDTYSGIERCCHAGAVEYLRFTRIPIH